MPRTFTTDTKPCAVRSMLAALLGSRLEPQVKYCDDLVYSAGGHQSHRGTKNLTCVPANLSFFNVDSFLRLMLTYTTCHAFNDQQYQHVRFIHSANGPMLTRVLASPCPLFHLCSYFQEVSDAAPQGTMTWLMRLEDKIHVSFRHRCIQQKIKCMLARMQIVKARNS